MTRRRLIFFAVAALLLGGLLLVRQLARQEPSEEHQLLALVDRLAAAVEAKEIKTVREHIAPDYADADGRRAEDLRRYLALLLLRQGQVSVYVLRKQVQVDHTASPLSARLQLTALLTRGPRVKQLSDLFPESARALAFELQLVKREDRWQLTSAAWSDVPDWRSLVGPASAQGKVQGGSGAQI